MSIIYEALRKTQRNREVRNMPTRERVAARNLDWLDKVLVVFVLLLLLIITAVYLPHFFKHRAVAAQTVASAALPVIEVKKTVAEVQAAVPAPTPVPVSAAATPPVHNLILNGVLLSENEKIALINKKTFHLGDNVDGMRIIKIEFDNVQLDDQGQLVTLRTSS